MKKSLLFTCAVSLFLVFSCSKEEIETEKGTLTEKEQLIKQAIIEFNKSAVKTGKYNTFVNALTQESFSKTVYQKDLEGLVADFLGDQTEEFLSVYNELEALKVTPEEFKSIAYQFQYLRITGISSTKNGNQNCCNAAGVASDSASILGALLDFVCGC